MTCLRDLLELFFVLTPRPGDPHVASTRGRHWINRVSDPAERAVLWRFLARVEAVALAAQSAAPSESESR